MTQIVNGAMVELKDIDHSSNLLRWTLGQVIEVYPDSDEALIESFVDGDVRRFIEYIDNIKTI